MPDVDEDDEKAFERVFELLTELMESVKFEANIDALQTAISQLQDALDNGTHGDENRAIIQWNLMMGLLTRFGIFGWVEDLAACRKCFPGTEGIATLKTASTTVTTCKT